MLVGAREVYAHRRLAGEAVAPVRLARDLFFNSPVNYKHLFNIIFSRTLINCSKLCSCPKIGRPILLGSQKYHLLVSVVKLQLAVTMVGS